jgi:hypothetical protein
VEQLPEEYADNMPIFYIISTVQTFWDCHTHNKQENEFNENYNFKHTLELNDHDQNQFISIIKREATAMFKLLHFARQNKVAVTWT